MLGILGNMLIVLGLAGKRYFYAKVIADFNKKLKGKMFAAFLYDNQLSDKDILSDLENDVKQNNSVSNSSLNSPRNKIIVDNIV